jgi:hypothetical protein
MCEAATLTAVGLGLSAVSAVGSGMASKQAADQQAEAMRAQAANEEIRAAQTIDQAAMEQGKLDRQNARLRGRQNALMAASGLDMNSGSLLDIAVDTAGEQTIDRQNIGFQGKLGASEHMNQADALNSQASMTKAGGNNAMLGGMLSAGGTILGGAGQLYGNYAGLDKLSKSTAKNIWKSGL